MTAARFPRAVLFDLDGTLLDSAPDFVATCNAMLAERGRAPIDPAVLRPVVSKGSRAMVGAAFPDLDAAARDALIPEFLQRYEALIGQHAVLFDGVAGMLAALDDAGTVWGIVTNKPEYLARLILPQHGWQQRCAVLVRKGATAHPGGACWRRPPVRPACARRAFRRCGCGRWRWC